MKKIVALTIATVFAGGCADRGIVDVSASQSGAPSADFMGSADGPGLTVMTWNVYYGTDPTIVVPAESFEQLLALAGQAWALAQYTNFPERAGRLARAIAAKRPHLVGLQEAAVWRTGDIGVPPATHVVYDFLSILTDSLAARGLHYIIAKADSTSDIEVPAVDPNTGQPLDVRLTDRDAVLVRADVRYRDARSAVYEAYMPVPTSFGTIPIKEGWSSVVATVGGQEYRFVSTHIEIQSVPDVQAGQVRELLASLKHEKRPTIVVGDFNSDVYGADPSAAGVSYGAMTRAGFTDTWLRPFWTPPGLTCCQNDSVNNTLSTFNQRVDFIFTRNMPRFARSGSFVLARDVVGDALSDRTKSGLWPSDHGGVVATFATSLFEPRWNVITE